MKKWIIIAVVVIFLAIIGASCYKETEQDRVYSSYNWGPDYYYDTNNHSVEKKPWK